MPACSATPWAGSAPTAEPVPLDFSVDDVNDPDDECVVHETFHAALLRAGDSETSVETCQDCAAYEAEQQTAFGRSRVLDDCALAWLAQLDRQPRRRRPAPPHWSMLPAPYCGQRSPPALSAKVLPPRSRSSTLLWS
ncbi:MAG: hypothetical protein ABIJ09_12500 [Pseudomonadota bacterium]